jgi:hypothetical protein
MGFDVMEEEMEREMHMKPHMGNSTAYFRTLIEDPILEEINQSILHQISVKPRHAMTDIYSLAGRARGKLAQEARRKDPHLRRVLGHAILLDHLFIELAVTESKWNESDAQDEVVGSEEDRCDAEDSDDADSDSHSDLGWDSDSDTDSDLNSEWHSSDYSAELERAVHDWTPTECWETAKPIIACERLRQELIVGVHEGQDEIES